MRGFECFPPCFFVPAFVLTVTDNRTITIYCVYIYIYIYIYIYMYIYILVIYIDAILYVYTLSRKYIYIYTHWHRHIYISIYIMFIVMCCLHSYCFYPAHPKTCIVINHSDRFIGQKPCRVWIRFFSAPALWPLRSLGFFRQF